MNEDDFKAWDGVTAELLRGFREARTPRATNEMVRILLRSAFSAGFSQRNDRADGRDEMRELLRWSQHHVDRRAPDTLAFLDRAMDALGKDFASGGTARLAETEAEDR